MKLATLRLDGGTVAVRIDGATAVVIPGAEDVGALLADEQWQRRAAVASGEPYDLREVGERAWAPVIPRPSKIICVGLNYREHILEMGREPPEFPTLFAKFSEALIGAYDDILVPAAAADAVDWEGELAVVVGRPVRGATTEEAADAIAGYSVLNDVTMRDRQYRTTQWLQGKTFESTCPFGPVMITADEFDLGAQLVTTVNGTRHQHASTDDLVFEPAELVSYVSSILTLNPGDVISTGTPGGVGHALPVPKYLMPGDILETMVEGIGELRNHVRLHPSA